MLGTFIYSISRYFFFFFAICTEPLLLVGLPQADSLAIVRTTPAVSAGFVLFPSTAHEFSASVAVSIAFDSIYMCVCVQ